MSVDRAGKAGIWLRLCVPLCAVLAWGIAACSSGDPSNPDGGADAGDASASDSGNKDSGAKDSGSNTGAKDSGADSGEPDSGTPADSGADADDGGIADAQPDVINPPPIDGGPAPDASACQQNYGFGTVSMNSCSSGENWTCGNDTYEVECSCPGLGCDCHKNGVSVKKVTAVNGCPQCTFGMQGVIAQCGFPY